MGKVTGLIFLDTIPETHACPDCGKEYKSREVLEKHIRDKHTPKPAREK